MSACNTDQRPDNTKENPGFLKKIWKYIEAGARLAQFWHVLYSVTEQNCLALKKVSAKENYDFE